MGEHHQNPRARLSCLLLLVCHLAHAVPKDLAELDAYIEFKRARDRLPGVAVSIVSDRGMLWCKGYGYENVETLAPMSTASVFCVASIAKSITAAAVLLLEEQGKLAIDRSVNDYLPFRISNPAFPGVAITIEQVLCHTSSISNGPSLWRNYRCGEHPMSLDQWAQAYFLPGGESWDSTGNFEQWAPGEGFQYSNAGYGLLACVVERASGLPFDEYCRTHFFEPLGMPATSFGFSGRDPSAFADMYARGDDWGLERDLAAAGDSVVESPEGERFIRLCHYSSPARGAGDLYSSAADLSRFLMMVLNRGVSDGKQVLAEESIQTMFSPHVDRAFLPGAFVDFGVGGYAMALDNGEAVWGHTGADPGTSTFMLYNADADLGAVVLANRFVDIRDLIPWVFAEGFRSFGDARIVAARPAWASYSDTPGFAAKRRTVTIRVVPPSLPSGDAVYVNGNHRYLGAWVTKGIPLILQADSVWERAFVLPESTMLAFKVTRGSWATQEVSVDGSIPEQRTFIVTADTTLDLSPAGWQDTCASSKP